MSHPDLATAEQALAVHTAEIDKKFRHVRVPEPCAAVYLPKLKTAPSSEELSENTVVIPFVRITSQPLFHYDSAKVLYPDYADAIAVWRSNLDLYLTGYPSAEMIYWRCKPEIEYEVDFGSDKCGFAVYSRLAVH